MPGNLCNYPLGGNRACNNPIKDGAPACWLHTDSVRSDQLRASEKPGPLEASASGVTVQPPRSWNTSRSMSVEIISDEIGIQPELAEALIRVSESVSSEHGNMMVPNSSIRALMEVGAHGYAKKLADEGVNPDRISFMRVQGLHRRTMSIPAVYDPDLEHTVCVLDHSPENEGVVVEPFMSAFAPVDSMSSEVDMVIPSGETVFTDAPWVGSISEYLNGSFMAWDSSSHSV